MFARGLALLCAAAFVAAPAATAEAAEILHPITPVLDSPVRPAEFNEPPAGFRHSARDVILKAHTLPEVQKELARGTWIQVRASLIGSPHKAWQIYYTRPPASPAVEVLIDDRDGSVMDVFTGHAVLWTMARGPEFAKDFESLWVWIPLCVLFVLPFFDWRRPFRLLHLDLLVLLAFGISHIYFRAGEIATSVPLVYPVLIYLLVRMLFAGFRRERRDEPLIPWMPLKVVVVLAVALAAGRVAYNVLESPVVDVGYASVIGADRIANNEELYVDNDIHGDTYGPLNYLAYVPLEFLFPYDGTWEDLPAAHAGAIGFDLAIVLTLILLARRLRPGRQGNVLAAALAYAWLAYPYTGYSLMANTNDALVGWLILLAFAALRVPLLRGVMIGAAAAAKFAPAVLIPLLATGRRFSWRGWALFAAGFLAIVVPSVLVFLPPGGFRELWDTTIGFQLGREGPFSLWGMYESLHPLEVAVKLVAATAAAAFAFFPRGERSPAQVAALMAAGVILLQLTVVHWHFFYIVWFAPTLFLALFASYGHPRRASRAGAPAVVLTRSRALGSAPRVRV